jgi:hypothetical protein
VHEEKREKKGRRKEARKKGRRGVVSAVSFGKEGGNKGLWMSQLIY